MHKKDGTTGFFSQHKLAVSAATMIGTIVGAGVLGIPYVVSKIGFLYGFLLLLFLGVAFLYLNLFLGEVVLRTKGQHQLSGYAEKYLGKWGKAVMSSSMFLGLYGALTAYLIGEGATLQALFGFGETWWYSLIFFVVVSAIIFRGVKTMGNVELILICLLFLVVVFITIFSFDQINLSNLAGTDIAKIFLPYGVILFAYIGFPAVPELQEVLGRDRKLMKKAIIIGSVLPIFLYIIFTFIVMSIVGLDQFELLEPNQRIATVALSIYSLPLLGKFANLLAVLAMFTSFLSLGTALKETYQFDFHMSRRLALFLTLSLPLVIAAFNLTTFVAILGVTGALAGGLDGIIITLMYWKAKRLGERTPEYLLPQHKLLGSIFILLFVAGILYLVQTIFW